MTTGDNFDQHRHRLLGLAYRMLGSQTDAEDIVQDTWLKWSNSDRATIRCDQSYLTTITTRLCLDKIKYERIRREAYQGPWLPEPVLDANTMSAESASEFADDLSYALLLTLERLSPLERAAFLLHDVFAVPFSEIATTLERSDSAVRQLASRARKTVRDAEQSTCASPETHQKLLIAFMQALADGDEENLKTVLRDDAVYISDGGGKRLAALRPIQGADRIIRLLLGSLQKFSSPASARTAKFALINGLPGLLISIDGVLDQTISLSVRQSRIAAIYVIRNPDKLVRLEPEPA